MNQLIRISLFIWVMAAALFTHIACMLVGFVLAFGDYQFMYNVTPFIGFTAVFILVRYAIHLLLHSDPVAYIKNKCEKIAILLKV